MAGASHRFEEHIGEVELQVTAPSREELYAEAARGLAELLGRAGEGAPERRTVTVVASDPEALMVQWIDELVFRTEQEGLLFPNVTVHVAGEQQLRATIGGLPIRETRTQVKAATYHGLEIRHDPSEPTGAWSASVVLDV